MPTEATIRAAFVRQARSCAALGSPFTAWLCERLGAELSARTAVGARVLRWPGDDPSSDGDSVPLRLCGALHALALSGDDPTLAAAYADPVPSGAAWSAIEGALRTHPDAILATLALPPQTNEVARSGALWPMLGTVAALAGRPLALLEVGASAGLNLLCDRFAYDLGGRASGDPGSAVRLAPEWRGPTPDAPDPVVASRAGCDLRPYDLADEGERRRLAAYTWPDQPERMARQRAAIALAAGDPPPVERADGVAWLRDRLATHLDGTRTDACATIYTTVAWQYLPAPDRAAGERIVAAAGARGPVAFVRMEADGDEPGAALTLDLWREGRHERHDLGRADFHGRWVEWRGV